jgi:hypothetical protein
MLLMIAFVLLLASTTADGIQSSSADGWRHLWKANPAGFESRLMRSLNGALERVQHLSARRWPWQRSDRALLLRTFPSASAGGWKRPGDALRLLLQVWRHRDDPIFLPGAIEALADLAQDERAVDELELYVPQIAYIILGDEGLLSSVLERFALRLCESNAHWALQLSWAVYGVLEDHAPDEGGASGASGASSAEAYSRAARLLQLIEQSVVYGATLVNRDSLRATALAHNVQLWRSSLLNRLRDGKGADGVADGALPLDLEAVPNTPPRAPPPTLQGWLLKRRERDRFGVWRCCGESWARRWFVLRGSVCCNASRASRHAPAVPLPSLPHATDAHGAHALRGASRRCVRAGPLLLPPPGRRDAAWGNATRPVPDRTATRSARRLHQALHALLARGCARAR